MKSNNAIKEATIVELNIITGDSVSSTNKLTLSWDGIIGDKHTSRTSIARTQDASDNGVLKGSEVLNLRQITILSKEELKETANLMGIPEISSDDVRANIIIEGLPNLSKLSVGTRMIFPEFAVIYITGENTPCIISGRRVQERFTHINGLAIQYPKAALNKRGLLAMVIRPGFVRVGDKIKIIGN